MASSTRRVGGGVGGRRGVRAAKGWERTNAAQDRARGRPVVGSRSSSQGISAAPRTSQAISMRVSARASLARSHRRRVSTLASKMARKSSVPMAARRCSARAALSRLELTANSDSQSSRYQRRVSRSAGGRSKTRCAVALWRTIWSPLSSTSTWYPCGSLWLVRRKSSMVPPWVRLPEQTLEVTHQTSRVVSRRARVPPTTFEVWF